MAEDTGLIAAELSVRLCSIHSLYLFHFILVMYLHLYLCLRRKMPKEKTYVRKVVSNSRYKHNNVTLIMPGLKTLKVIPFLAFKL